MSDERILINEFIENTPFDSSPSTRRTVVNDEQLANACVSIFVTVEGICMRFSDVTKNADSSIDVV
jgi:hypothetical protein